MKNRELKMSFDPRTIEHLGIKMYSRLPNAIAELIANAYDACAKEVIVNLYDSDNNNKSIIVEDDGEGMTFDEINDKFLRIGRNRREDGEKESSCGRIVTGRKGLGKLAFFGIGDVIKIETYKSGEKTIFILDWNKLIHTPPGQDYKPASKNEKCDSDLHGTTITLTKLRRKTKFDFDGLSKSLARLFNFPDKFSVFLKRNDTEVVSIDNKLKYDGIEPEFEWKFPECIDELMESDNEFEFKNEIAGEIITTKKPIKPGMRGITLFANGRMVNIPEFFGNSESSHFYSYTTGWLDVDFVDNWDEDVISTNRQSLDWDNQKTGSLKNFLCAILAIIHQEWRRKRKLKRRDEIQNKTKININEWFDTLPDGIKENVERIVTQVDDSELPENEQSSTLSSLHYLVPEYPYLHWRHLHPEIQRVSETYYKNKDYYNAFLEALKRYVTEVRRKSGSTNSNDRSMMGEVFSGRKLLVTKNYKKTDGASFSDDTIDNIEAGQHYLSEGTVLGGRNTLSHEEHRELRLSGLFSEKDCLDFLSLLSHLFKRLEDSEAV